MDIKGKMIRNESHREKNRGPIYVPRFITFSILVFLFLYKITKTHRFSYLKPLLDIIKEEKKYKIEIIMEHSLKNTQKYLKFLVK